jgi:hypothetical protein
VYDDTRQLYMVRAGLQDPTFNWPLGATNSDKVALMSSVWNRFLVSITNSSYITRGVETKLANWYLGATANSPYIGIGSAWLSQFYTSGRAQGQNIPASYTKLGDGVNTYCTWSAALSYAEVNVLTGEVKEKHGIIAVDIGNMTDALANVGQAEGGYNFGKGYFVQEKILYDDATGKVLNNGTWDYKPACPGNAPERMDTLFLNDQTTWFYPGKIVNLNGLLWQNKPTTETTTTVSSAYWIAIREAIRAYRNANNIQPANKYTWLDTYSGNLTIDKIKNACPTIALN